MMGCKALLLIFGLTVATPALANAAYQDEFANTLSEMGFAIGRIDYCGTGGQALFNRYARGLEEFRLHPAEIQALLTLAQQRREASRAEAAQKFGGRPCPAETRATLETARQQIDAAWRQIVRNAPQLDIRPAMAQVLATRSPAPAQAQGKPPASTPTPAHSANTPAAAGLCVKGHSVSVLHGGEWHPAKVLNGPDGMGTCLVSYDGFGSNWDEWVSAQRMRPTAASQSAKPTPTATAPKLPPATPAQVPPGKYSCYTFDNGALNYAFTDVQILDGSRYAVGAKGGNYTLSQGGAMRFTGTMANATGTFSVKNTGKPQIDLVFNGDARASMACTKAG